MDEYEESETVDCDDWPDWIGWNCNADGNSDNAECDDPEEMGPAEYDALVEACFGDEYE